MNVYPNPKPTPYSNAEIVIIAVQWLLAALPVWAVSWQTRETRAVRMRSAPLEAEGRWRRPECSDWGKRFRFGSGSLSCSTARNGGRRAEGRNRAASDSTDPGQTQRRAPSVRWGEASAAWQRP